MSSVEAMKTFATLMLSFTAFTSYTNNPVILHTLSVFAISQSVRYNVTGTSTVNIHWSSLLGFRCLYSTLSVLCSSA